MHSPLPLFETDALRLLEARGIAACDGDAFALMARAGQAAWRCVLKHWPREQRIVVACGPGNNGGDGYVLARHAHASGRDVQVQPLAGLNLDNPGLERDQELNYSLSFEIKPAIDLPEYHGL